jgi:Starch-binding associating with outer membrane/Susd and RagB outer membrane lipoprotein
LFSSCETFDLEQTQDPNKVAPENLEIVLAFNYIQLQLPDFVNSANSFTQRVTRQMAMTGGNSYSTSFDPVSSNNNWATGYNLLNAIKGFQAKADSKKDYYGIGASKVIRCYVLATLVDIYGDIPYTEALLGNANYFPKFDASKDVYRGILAELEDAKATLQRTDDGPIIVNDLYYNSKQDWVRLANTIKLKMLITSRLAASDLGIVDIKSDIQSILDSGNYINSTDKDFEFKYGKTQVNPISRHPEYYRMYEAGAQTYIANYMFWTMTSEKGFTVSDNAISTAPIYDPRTYFYFFKQVSLVSNTNAFILPGRSRPAHYDEEKYNSFYNNAIPTCYTTSNWVGTTISGADQPNLVSNGYWGRDHGNDSGIPQDNNSRTVIGLYPIGGEIGFPRNVQNLGIDGALGQGIMPMILASYVKFLKAEAILTLGVSGDAKQEMLDGITLSMDKTINFIPSYQRPSTIVSAVVDSQKAAYLNFISTRYTPLTNDKKLEMIIKEYFIASWGNGIEPYNNYRRTSYPSNLQPTLEPISGDYFNTAYYPLSSQNNNPNMPNNVRTKKVFWHKSNVVLH